MEKNKDKISEKNLDKVSGGFQIGDQNIVECEACHTQFDPDTVERGPDAIGELENGGYGYATYKCPNCNEFHRVKVIQIKKGSIQNAGVIYFAE